MPLSQRQRLTALRAQHWRRTIGLPRHSLRISLLASPVASSVQLAASSQGAQKCRHGVLGPGLEARLVGRLMACLTGRLPEARA